MTDKYALDLEFEIGTGVTGVTEIESIPANSVRFKNTLTNVSAQNVPKIVSNDADFTITYTATTGSLPDAITVKVGGTTLTAGENTYTWAKDTGVLTIKSAAIKGDIEVTVTAA